MDTPLVLSLSLIDRQTLLNWSYLSLTDGQMPLVMPGMTSLSLTDGRTPLVMSWMSSLSLSGGQTPLVLSGMSSLSVIDGQTPLYMSGMSSLSLSGGQTPLVLSGTSSFRQNRRHQSFLAASGLAEARARWSLQKDGPKPPVFTCYRTRATGKWPGICSPTDRSPISVSVRQMVGPQLGGF